MCVNEVRLEKKWQKKVENPSKLVILSLWPFHLRIEEQLQLINGNIKRWEIRVSWVGQSTSTGFVPLNCLQQGPWITVLTQRWQPSTSCLWRLVSAATACARHLAPMGAVVQLMVSAYVSRQSTLCHTSVNTSPRLCVVHRNQTKPLLRPH